MDQFDFSAAKAVVLGGGSGLGFAMAEALVRRGASVCVASRSQTRVDAAVTHLNTIRPESAVGLVCDVTSEPSVRMLGAALHSRWPAGVNIAINSAGTNVRNPIERIELAEWEQIQRTNSTGAFLFAREMYPLLRQAAWGRLINVASIFSMRGYAHRASYAASKGAMLQLTRTLALEWAAEGITVNALTPGPFRTEINLPVVNNPENYRRFCERIPLGRFGNPEEIVTACLFLASPASGYVTGSAVAVDGGWTPA